MNYNAKHGHKIIALYQNKLTGQNIPLDMDVFGIASFGESKYIGQNLKLFSQSVDAIRPQVYPSHYVFQEMLFQAMYALLKSIKKQFDNKMSAKSIFGMLAKLNNQKKR